MPKRLAAKTYQVPCTTITEKVAGWTQLGRKIGKATYLTPKEEEDLVK